MKVKLNNVRLAFAQLFEAKQVNGEGDAAFSASFLFPPNHPAVKELEAAFEQVAKEKWGPKAGDILKAARKGDKLCLHDGDLKSQYDGFPGNMFVSARNKVRPTVLNRDKSPVTAADGVIYAGCYVNAIVELWAQDNKYGKRINASLGGVQFFKDGDAFAGGGVADESDFDSIEDGAEAEDLA